LAALTALVLTLTAGASAAGAGGIRTAVFDPVAFTHADRQAQAFGRTRAAGASMARLTLSWKDIAPQAIPPGFNATDPLSPHYNWGWFDREVQAAVAAGLEPFVEVFKAPPWAAGDPSGIVRPNPVEFGKFAYAAAARYSGRYPGIPRVRYWMAWAEPNRDYFLFPQYEGGRIVAARLYRDMLYHFAANVWAVAGSNRVIAGGLSPLARRGKPAPLAFMREMFCLTRSLRRACDLRGRPIPFDIWAHNPYSTGSPTLRSRGDNVMLGDLPKLKRTLRAAVRAGHVRSHGGVGLWATEFGWDSNPPDPRAISTRLQARWISEAIYRMWRAGVTLATWWKIDDDPLTVSRYQSGLFTSAGSPKRGFTAFRFPVVAFARPSGLYVWGRTPRGAPGRVAVRLNGRRLGTLRANRYGIFSRTFRTWARRGTVQARFGRQRSVPFSLARVRNLRVPEPFGCGGPAHPC